MAAPPEVTTTKDASTDSKGDVDVKLEVKKEKEPKAPIIVQFEELIETVMTTIQEPDVTDAGVAAVVARLQAYSAGISAMVNNLPPDATSVTPNGSMEGGGVSNKATILPKIESADHLW